MADNGSKRWFGYESNAGEDFAVQLDESVYETADLGFTAVAANALPISATGRLPFKLRRVACYRVEGQDTLRTDFFVGTEAALAAIVTAKTITVGGVVWNASKAFGEEVKIIPATDTEILDTDVDNNFAP